MFKRHFHPSLMILLLLALCVVPYRSAHSETISDPTSPTLTVNTGLQTLTGAAGLITSAVLRAENGAVPAVLLFYTLQSTPQHGTLTLNGVVLSPGDSFTQGDIDAGNIAYQNDGGSTSLDNISFILSHGPLIQRVSVLGDGTPITSPQADGLFHLSGDGHYFSFFTPEAVVPMAYNGKNNIFMRDIETGGTMLISRGDSGSLSNGDSILPYISYDGRYVVFASNASNLLSDSTILTNEYHIYRFDTLQQSMEKVDLFPVGNQFLTLQPQGISDNGQVILFTADILNQSSELYAFDFNTHHQTQITTFQQDPYFVSTLSADGRFIATYDGWLYDWQAQPSTSQSIPHPAGSFSLSGDGQYLAFIGPDGLAPGDHNSKLDVLVYDRVANTYELIPPPNQFAADIIFLPTISADGRYLAYVTNQTADQIQNLQVIVHDRVLNTDRVASTSATDQPGNYGSLNSGLSAKGDRILFYSMATNLVSDGSSNAGYYVRQLLTSEPETFSISIDQNKYYFLPFLQISGSTNLP